MNTMQDFETVDFDETTNELLIIDQTLLPKEVKIIRLRTAPEIWNAIYSLQVRGAPAIGVAAGFGLYLLAAGIESEEFDVFYEQFEQYRQYLDSSRPTAVNLFWALNRMRQIVIDNKDKNIARIKQQLLEEAWRIKKEDGEVCRAIGEYGLSLLKKKDGILTHCNAGRLATSRYGTATAPIYLGQERGYEFRVFCDETRPLLQGARLTAYELMAAGVDTTVICDNMAASVMTKGWIQAVLVGCDRVAANGDTANKIGTLQVAILAGHYGIPFYVCAPTSTIDFSIQKGTDIVIEQRNPEEITTMWYQSRMAPDDVKIYNPAFDVTPHELISGIITEKGIMRAPYEDSLRKITPSRY